MKRQGFLISVLMAVAILVLALQPPITAQENSQTNTSFIIDASGSMRASLGNELRITTAQHAVSDLIAELPDNANVSLWAYGHRLPQDDPSASCQDIEEIIPLGQLDRDAFTSAVNSLNAIGYTPISDTLQQVATTMPDGDRNIIVLLSDGEETCNADPCAVARDLAAANIDLRVNTIGFAVDYATQQQLQCIADVTGGTYYAANDADSLSQSLKEASAIDTGTLQLVDANGIPLRNLLFGVVGADGTNRSGEGSLNLPEGNYTITVETIPPFETTVDIQLDTVTEVVVAGAGTIQLINPDGTPNTDTTGHVLNPTSDELIDIFTGSIELQAGTYQIDIHDVISLSTQVEVVPGETININLAQSGTVTTMFTDGTPTSDLYFTIFNDDGSIVASFFDTGEVPIGKYLISMDTNPTEVRPITIEGGVETVVELQYPGTLRVNDPTGMMGEVYFNLKAPESNELLVPGFDELAIQPGIYAMTAHVGGHPDIVFSIVSGEILELDLSIGGLRINGFPDNGWMDAYPIYENGEEGSAESFIHETFENGVALLYRGTWHIDVQDDNRDTVYTRVYEVQSGEVIDINLGD